MPTVIRILHEFENHNHAVCVSKIEQHTHENDVDCKLDVLKKTDGFTNVNNNFTIILEQNDTRIITQYNFLLNHQPLSLSLRGPPTLV